MANKKKNAVVTEDPAQTQNSQTPQTPDPQAQQTTDPSERRVIVCTARGLNLREGPAREYNIRAVLKDGAELAVPELPEGAEVSGWTFVHEPLLGSFGWVDTRFIKSVES